MNFKGWLYLLQIEQSLNKALFCIRKYVLMDWALFFTIPWLNYFWICNTKYSWREDIILCIIKRNFSCSALWILSKLIIESFYYYCLWSALGNDNQILVMGPGRKLQDVARRVQTPMCLESLSASQVHLIHISLLKKFQLTKVVWYLWIWSFLAYIRFLPLLKKCPATGEKENPLKSIFW